MPMRAPRAGHTATLLKNGKLLVVAGRAAGDLTSAELYDPVRNSWSAAGNISAARTGHTALVLRGGKVLVWGGSGPAGHYLPAEVYDPDSNGWSVVPGTEYNIRMAIVLADGRVLALGDAQNWTFQFSRIFDPDSRAWTDAARPSFGMAQSILLGSGKVLFYQNYDPGAGILAQQYDPKSDTWSAVSPMSIALFGPPVLLRDGRVLVAGSARTLVHGCSAGCANAEVFDPSTGKWSLIQPMTIERGEHTMTVLADGKVLVAGGAIPPNGGTQAASEVFDPAGAHN
jgi:hypothetical protein